MTAPASAADSSLLAAELASLSPLADCRGLRVFAFHATDCPSVMAEVGRCREVEFRAAGAGRGEERDLDPLDFHPQGYQQLIVWDADARELVAMLRFQFGARAVRYGLDLLRTHSLFEYAAPFQREWLPHSVELGRLVVRARARLSRLGLFALWQGLGELVRRHEIASFFGNVSIYDGYPDHAKHRLVSLVEQLYAGPEPHLLARKGLRFVARPERLAEVTPTLAGKLEHVRQSLSGIGVKLPIMLQSYLQLGANVICGQAVVDADFGGALEIGIVVPISAIEGKRRALFAL